MRGVKVEMPSREELEIMLRKAFHEMGVDDPTEHMMKGLTFLVFKKPFTIVVEGGAVVSIDVFKKKKVDPGKSDE